MAKKQATKALWYDEKHLAQAGKKLQLLRTVGVVNKSREKAGI